MTDSNESRKSLPVCVDHMNADWNRPQIDRCVLCSLFYLEAQESLLEEWQQRALRAEDAIAEMQRPLDAQMARLNATVVRLNEENERLRKIAEATQPCPHCGKRPSDGVAGDQPRVAHSKSEYRRITA